MSFHKTISIIVPPNLTGPPGWDHLAIVMAFNQDAIKSENPFTPAAWNVTTVLLDQPAQQNVDVTYVADTGVSKAQVDDGNVVQPELELHLGVGQQTTLHLKAGTPTFTVPVSFTASELGVNIELTTLPTIAAGLFDKASPPNFSPISVWQNIPNQATVDIEFTPTLSIYYTADFVQSQLLPGKVDGLLWTQNLNDAGVPNPVKLTLVWDATQGLYELI